MSDQLVDVHTLAETLAVPVGWCYRAAEEKRIPSLKVGKYLRFDLRKVLETLEGGKDDC